MCLVVLHPEIQRSEQSVTASVKAMRHPDHFLQAWTPLLISAACKWAHSRHYPELFFRVFVWKRLGIVNTVRIDSAGYEKSGALFFGIAECQGHNPCWNKMHPLINKGAGSSGLTACRLFNPAKDRKGGIVESSDKWLQSRKLTSGYKLMLKGNIKSLCLCEDALEILLKLAQRGDIYIYKVAAVMYWSIRAKYRRLELWCSATKVVLKYGASTSIFWLTSQS